MTRPLRRMGRALLPGFFLLVTACTYVQGNVPIDAEIPYAPIIEPLPMRVGICYTPRLRDYVVLLDKDRARFEVGQASLRIFDRAVNGMFDDVEQVPCSDSDGRGVGPLDGTIEIDLTWHLASLDFFHLLYLFKVYSADGSLVSSIEITGKGDWVYLGDPTVVSGKVARDAIRDAASHFMLSFETTTEIERWLSSMGKAVPEKTYVISPLGRDWVVAFLPDLTLYQTRTGATPYGTSKKDKGAWYESCIRSEMGNIKPSLRVLVHDEVRNILFPWYERWMGPRARHKTIAKFLAKRNVQSRLSDHGVRFVVSVKVLTSLGEQKGGILRSTEAFGLGHQYRSRRTEIIAVVWEVDGTEEPRELVGLAEGTSALTSVVIPIPTGIARTEQKACEDISRQLVEYFEARLGEEGL